MADLLAVFILVSSNMCATGPLKNLRLYFGLTGGQHPNPLNSIFLFLKVRILVYFAHPNKKGVWPMHPGYIFVRAIGSA